MGKESLLTGGVANSAVIDLFGFDQKTGEVLLVMNEPRPWNGGDEQLHELQEKFNAYASFILDGEMTSAHPELVGKSARIELRCDHMPSENALALLQAIHDQLELQSINVEVVVADRSCGNRCGCHSERSREIPTRNLNDGATESLDFAGASLGMTELVFEKRSHRRRVEFSSPMQKLQLDQKDGFD